MPSCRGRASTPGRRDVGPSWAGAEGGGAGGGQQGDRQLGCAARLAPCPGSSCGIGRAVNRSEVLVPWVGAGSPVPGGGGLAWGRGVGVAGLYAQVVIRLGGLEFWELGGAWACTGWGSTRAQGPMARPPNGTLRVLVCCCPSEPPAQRPLAQLHLLQPLEGGVMGGGTVSLLRPEVFS